VAISRFLLRCAVVAALAVCMTAAATAAGAATSRSGVARAATATVTVTSRAGSGRGSFAAAIRAADAAPAGTRTLIRFSVTGTIAADAGLPPVTRPVTIDGRTAPGYRDGGPPAVEVNCHGHPGLVFAVGSGGSQLWALSITAASGNGVTLDAGSITLDRNYIGITPAGHRLGNRGSGVFVSATSAGNRIGLNPSGASGVVANVISGNKGSGLVLDGSSGNTVAANRIGTSPAGTARLANNGNGLLITAGAHGNEIGGTRFTDSATGQVNNPTGSKGTTTPVFVVPPLGNLISGNLRNGVLINSRAHGNTLNGNFIGTTASGDAALGNAGNGVWLDHAPGNSLIGCKFTNNPFVYYNVVSGNGRNGLRVTDSANAVVQGNFFGAGADNTAIVRNRADGVRVDGTSANTQVGGVIPLGNVAAGNGRNGIEVTGRVHGFITFNTFGGLLAFKGAAPNGNDGLLITATGGGNVARTNVFSGNRRNGIELAGNASRVVIDPDIVGLTTKGNAVLPNGGDGLLIHGTAHDNAIGGYLRSVIPQNTFSGNRGYGVAITGHAYRNVVFTSDIGTEILGVSALGNSRGGLLITGRARENVVGFPHLHPANLISGNTGKGVTISQRACSNVVSSNYIGLNRFARALPNSGRELVNNGCRNVILGNRFPR
jgi:parallel beta-helix repeat protein